MNHANSASARSGGTPTRRRSGTGLARAERPETWVSIRSLKEDFVPRLPADHSLREVLLNERDLLTKEELVAKAETWLLLLRRQS